MPSPIAHCGIAFLIWPHLKARDGGALSRYSCRLLAGTLVVSLCAADADFLLAKAGLHLTHRGLTHSVAAALLWATLWGAVLGRLVPLAVGRLWLVLFLAYLSHPLLDMCGRGRGVTLLWPWQQQMSIPLQVFVGLEHSQPWAWRLHIWTVFNELAFVAVIWVLADLFARGSASARPGERT